MATKKPAAKTTKATKESGVVYLSSTGNYYNAPKITADKIRDFKDNIYARGLALKQKNLLFSGKYWFEVTDTDGNQDEEIELDMTTMCDSIDVQLWSKIQMAWMDQFWYGTGLFNPVWEYTGNVYTLQKLRHLPASSFDTAPWTGDGLIYSQILQGITLNDKKEIEYYQTQDDTGTPEKLDNVYMVKDPTSISLAGEPIILPLIPVISMLKFVWDTQMQQANRIGAKILFIKVTDPQAASSLNGNVSDMDAAKEILKYWGKDSAFPLRGNMEIIDPHIKDDSNNLEIIEVLNQMLIDYISPINLLTAANDSAKLGGSDSQRMELILRYIRSVHSWLEDSFSLLLQPYLDANGYEGYTVRVHLPVPEIDSSEIDLKRADSGVRAKVLKPNEIRELLGEEPLIDEELVELEDYYKRNQPEIPQLSFSSKLTETTKKPKLISIDDLLYIMKMPNQEDREKYVNGVSKSFDQEPLDKLPDNVDEENVEETIEEIESIGTKLSKGLVAALKHEV